MHLLILFFSLIILSLPTYGQYLKGIATISNSTEDNLGPYFISGNNLILILSNEKESNIISVDLDNGANKILKKSEKEFYTPKLHKYRDRFYCKFNDTLWSIDEKTLYFNAIIPLNSKSNIIFQEYNNWLYFVLNEPYKNSLYKTDGQSNTMFLKELQKDYSAKIFAHNKRLYYTNGTAINAFNAVDSSNYILYNAMYGPNITFDSLSSTHFIFSTHGMFGFEQFYKTDGTIEGTEVIDVRGASFIYDYIIFKNNVIHSSVDRLSNYSQLATFNLDNKKNEVLLSYKPDSGVFRYINSFNKKFYALLFGKLFISDGTQLGTHQIAKNANYTKSTNKYLFFTNLDYEYLHAIDTNLNIFRIKNNIDSVAFKTINFDNNDSYPRNRNEILVFESPTASYFPVKTRSNIELWKLELNNITSINSKVKENIKVIPNPSTSTIFISNHTEIKEITILNNLGARIKTFSTNDFKGTLDISFLNPEVYFLEIIKSNKEKTITKIVKE